MKMVKPNPLQVEELLPVAEFMAKVPVFANTDLIFYPATGGLNKEVL